MRSSEDAISAREVESRRAPRQPADRSLGARLGRRLGREPGESRGPVQLKPRSALQTERSYEPLSGVERASEMGDAARESRASL